MVIFSTQPFPSTTSLNLIQPRRVLEARLGCSFASTLCLNLRTTSISPSTILTISISPDERLSLVWAPNPSFFLPHLPSHLAQTSDKRSSGLYFYSILPLYLPHHVINQTSTSARLVIFSTQPFPSITSLNLIQLRRVLEARLGCSFLPQPFTSTPSSTATRSPPSWRDANFCQDIDGQDHYFGSRVFQYDRQRQGQNPRQRRYSSRPTAPHLRGETARGRSYPV